MYAYDTGCFNGRVVADLSSAPFQGAQYKMLEEIYATQREVESIFCTCEQVLSAEQAWKDAVGSTTLSALVFECEELAQKLQAAEQDLLDNSDTNAEVVQQTEEAIEKRQHEEKLQVALQTRKIHELEGLKQRATALARKLSLATVAEQEFLSSKRQLQAELVRPAASSEFLSRLLHRQKEVRDRLSKAHVAAAATERSAAEAEENLLQAKFTRAALAQETETGTVSWAAESVADETVRQGAAVTTKTAHTAKLEDAIAKKAIWRGLCEKSQVHAKTCEAKAERAMRRSEAAERTAEAARKAFDESQEELDAAMATVKSTKADVWRRARQQEALIGTTFALACLALMQVMGGPCQLEQDATACICFVAGALFMGLQRSVNPAFCSRRNHARVSCCDEPESVCQSRKFLTCSQAEQ